MEIACGGFSFHLITTTAQSRPMYIVLVAVVFDFPCGWPANKTRVILVPQNTFLGLLIFFYFQHWCINWGMTPVATLPG